MVDDGLVKDLLRQIPLFQSAYRDLPSSSPLTTPTSASISMGIFSTNSITATTANSSTPTPAISPSSSVSPTLSPSLSDHEDLFFTDLAKDIRLRSFCPGDVIIQEGEQAKCVFFIFRGSVEVVSADGELVLSVLEVGSYFGEIAVLFETMRVATVRCLTKCLLGVLTGTDLQLQLQKYPKMKETVANEARLRYARAKSELERSGKANLQESLYERKISIMDIGRTTSTKSVESPSGRRNSNLGLSVSMMPTADMTSPGSDALEDDTIDEDDSEDLPEIPCIDHSTQSHQSTHVNASTVPIMEDPPQPRRLLPKQSSEGSEVDQTNNIAGIALTIPNNGSGSPAHLTANSYVSSLAQLHSGKRRASVAVWSDDKLMQLAQSAADKLALSNTLQGSPKHSTSSNSRLHSSNSQTRASVLSPMTLSASASDCSVDFPASIQESEEDSNLRVFPSLPNRIALGALEYLDVRTLMRLRAVSQTMLQYLDETAVPAILTTVDLSPWHKKITDAVLLQILLFCGHAVRRLILKTCWQVTDKGLQSIAQCSPQIEILNLASVWDITDTGVAALARSASFLKALDLSNCRKLSDAAVLAVLSFARGVKMIHLSYCKNLTDAAMEHATWSGVRSLNLQRCTAVSDAGFAFWAAAMSPESDAPSSPPSVTYQIAPSETLPEVSAAPSSTETGEQTQLTAAHHQKEPTRPKMEHPQIQLILPPQPPPPTRFFELRELILSDCSFLTDTTVTTLTKTCPKLNILSLSFCCALTEASIQPLSTYTNLRVLDLSFCGSAVADSGLARLSSPESNVSKRLERLSVRGCVQVTDAGIDALKGCSRLRMLNVSQCKNVKRSGDTLKTQFGWVLLSGGELVTDGFRKRVWDGDEDEDDDEMDGKKSLGGDFLAYRNDILSLGMRHERALTQ
ncbi:anaphase-promoting complex subunit Hcn1 [Chytriomyces hyalinus]|nr:anaphase-promoting complex subunit Hcn1 [Chytriomyces hyalinus]